MTDDYDYQLKAEVVPGSDWVSVTKEEWIKAERAAGFRPTLWSGHPEYMTTCATGGFSNSQGISGRLVRAVPATDLLVGWEAEEKLTVEEAWTILCETPDITSPEGYPDHALITIEQLGSFMARASTTVNNPATLENSDFQKFDVEGERRENERETPKQHVVTRRALELAEGRLSLLLEAYPDESATIDHPSATRYVLEQLRVALSAEVEG